MKKVYIVYSVHGTGHDIGKSITVFDKEVDAARYASMNNLLIIEKTLV